MVTSRLLLPRDEEAMESITTLAGIINPVTKMKLDSCYLVGIERNMFETQVICK